MCLNRIHKIKDLNAYITVTEDIAEEQAAQADKRISKGIWFTYFFNCILFVMI